MIAEQMMRHHELIVDRLKRLAIGGQLNPFNRTTSFRDKIALISFVFVVVVPISSNVLMVLYYNVLSRYMAAAHLDTIQDRLILAVFLFLVQICIASTTFMCLIPILELIDQLAATERFTKLMLNVVDANDTRIRELQRIMGASSLTDDWQRYHVQFDTDASKQRPIGDKLVGASDTDRHVEIREQIELDLLTIVMQSRLVLRSFRLARGQLNLIASNCVLVMTYISVVLRWHSSYFMSELNRFSAKVSLTLTLTGVLFLVPLAVLHERIIRAHKVTWSLVAQMSYLESLNKINELDEFETSIATLTLRRQLADPPLEQFACHVLLMPITYRNVLRIAFWLVLVIIPLFDSTAIFGPFAFMQDPLRIYRLA
jgi:hypothetical protein